MKTLWNIDKQVAAFVRTSRSALYFKFNFFILV